MNGSNFHKLRSTTLAYEKSGHNDMKLHEKGLVLAGSCYKTYYSSLLLLSFH